MYRQLQCHVFTRPLRPVWSDGLADVLGPRSCPECISCINVGLIGQIDHHCNHALIKRFVVILCIFSAITRAFRSYSRDTCFRLSAATVEGVSSFAPLSSASSWIQTQATPVFVNYSGITSPEFIALCYSPRSIIAHDLRVLQSPE